MKEHVETFEKFIFKSSGKFKKDDFIRYSHAKNQIGNPAFYGIVQKANNKTLSILFLASGSHNNQQPDTRYKEWGGGKIIPWDGPYTEKELQSIASQYDFAIGSGWLTKHATKWDPTDF